MNTLWEAIALNTETTVKIPEDAIIPPEKLTSYLLVPRPSSDKSKDLAQAGFTDQNPEALLAALRQHANSNEASEDGIDQYGISYKVEGILQGVNGTYLDVITVWKCRGDQRFYFVTLKPNRRANP